MRSLYFLVACIFLLTPVAQAWDSGGHMLVSTVAYQRLTPGAKKQAEALIALLPDERVATSDQKPRPYDFVSAACWMDDIRSSPQFASYASWHYIDLECAGNPDAVKKPNALSAIEDSQKVLRSKDATSAEQAQALAILIHVVGDIHQPLHCSGRDLGGNTYAITGVPDMAPQIRETENGQPVYQRLHAYWDAAYKYGVTSYRGQKRLVRLLFPGDSAKPDMNAIASFADLISRRYPASEKDTTQVRDWMRESNEISCQFVFSTPAKQQPSLEYFDKANDISCRRITLAGYRLANLLNAIFVTNE